MPKTLLGKWSVGLIILFFSLFATLNFLAASGQEGGDTFSDNLTLAIPALGAGAAGVLAFFTGIIGIIRSKERSVLVFVASAIGLLILLFMLGEILSPH
ncbi:MAG: hypothetical protein MUP14_07275 [Dehalococcoidia bacterium]|nr:hypothetical protein [Dehalococcoidia bacterium]